MHYVQRSVQTQRQVPMALNRTPPSKVARHFAMTLLVSITALGCGGKQPATVNNPATTANSKPPTNQWFKHNKDSDTHVIFVHGIFSSSDTCWRNESNGAYWPSLVASDDALGHPSVFLADYPTTLETVNYDIKDAITTLHDDLVAPRSDQLPRPL